MSLSSELQIGPADVRLMEADPSAFRRAFNRASFAFTHHLADHPLFELPRMARVAERILEGPHGGSFVVFDGKTASTGSKFSSKDLMARLPETIRGVGEAGTWLKLSSVHEVDPEYDRLFRQILLELEDLSGLPLRRETNWSGMTIFVASPGVVTPYHIDHESNFLFQIRGEKDVHLYDPQDRRILSEPEIERFYIDCPQAANYREELEEEGTAYRLTPGAVVHHPPLAPHWVKNGDNVSVSVSVGLSLRSLEFRARVYQVNYCLRTLGLRPLAPGRSHLVDRLKSASLQLLSKSKPKNRGELLFSGINRVAAPIKFARRVLRHGDRPPV